MLTVEEALEAILAEIGVTGVEQVMLDEALARTLAATVTAERRLPPWDNSAMDGFAVRLDEVAADPTAPLAVTATVGAGDAPSPLAPGGVARIMTGAPVPAGADTVVPQELAERTGDAVRMPATAKGVNVRLRGEDVQAGAVVIRAGTVLRPQELGVVASLGHPQVLVRQRVRVAVLSTGDEVAEPGESRKPGQIYDSNRSALRGLIEQAGGAATNGSQRIQISRQPAKMHRDDGLGSGSDHLGCPLRIDIEGIRLNVGEYRGCPTVNDHVGSGCKGERGGDDFVTWPDAERLQ